MGRDKGINVIKICCIFNLGHVQNPPDQNPPSQIREPLTDRGLGVTVIVKKKKLNIWNKLINI